MSSAARVASLEEREPIPAEVPVEAIIQGLSRHLADNETFSGREQQLLGKLLLNPDTPQTETDLKGALKSPRDMTDLAMRGFWGKVGRTPLGDALQVEGGGKHSTFMVPGYVLASAEIVPVETVPEAKETPVKRPPPGKRKQSTAPPPKKAMQPAPPDATEKPSAKVEPSIEKPTAQTTTTVAVEQIRVGEDGEVTWQDYANCLGVDPDLFFPERGASTREAKAVCGGCVVREECLDYALAIGEKFGIWGGMSERERRRIRRARTLALRAAAQTT